MTRLRSLAVSALAVAALGSLAACSSDSGSGSTSAPPTSASPPSTAFTTTTTTVPASAPASASASSTSGSLSSGSGNAQCAESQLRASVKADDIPGENRHVVKLFFKNKSDSDCTLTGFPGAATVDVKGNQEQQAKRVIGGPVGGTIEKPGPVKLRAGATAYAYLEGSSTREKGAAQAGCDGPGFPRILVTPPNTDIPVPFTIGWPLCYTLNVHPVRIDT